MRRIESDRRPLRSLAGVCVGLVLIAGCVGPTPTGTPPVDTSPSGTISSPAPSATMPPPSTSIPTASPAPTETPAPTPPGTQAPNEAGWSSAGSTVERYEAWRATVVPLAGGGALLLGLTTEDSDHEVQNLSAEVWDPATNGWHRAEPLAAAPNDSVLVPLEDGRVLLAGGSDPNDETSRAGAWIFDPGAGAWTKAASMTEPRTAASGVQLSDGRVLVVGGYFYAPEEWAAAPNGAITSFGSGGLHAAGRAALLDVVPPPQGPALATAEIYDPATNRWERTGAMRYARTQPSVVRLADDRVLVVGASNLYARMAEDAFRTAELYDPGKRSFGPAGILPHFDRVPIESRGLDLPGGAPEPGVVGSLVALRDGGAVLVGREASWKHQGQVVWSSRLEPGLGTWRNIGEAFGWLETHDPEGGEIVSTGVSRLDAVVAPLPDGSVLVAGGSIGYSVGWSFGPPPVSVERYRPGADVWSSLPKLPEAREHLCGTVLTDGSVLIVGGQVPAGPGKDPDLEWAREAYRFVAE